MKGKYRIINIVLTIVLVLLLIVNTLVAIGMGLSEREDKEWETSYERVGDLHFEKIGDEYEEEKRKGYSYYRLMLPVQNTGRRNMTADDLYIQVEGEDYSEVYEYYTPYDENESDLIRYNKEILPSMQKGELEKVFWIQKGTEQVHVTFYTGREDYYAEENGEEIIVALPE